MIILFLISVLTLLLFFNHRKHKNFPPGPPRLPIVGSLPWLIKYPTLFKRMHGMTKKYGEICGFYSGNQPIVILSNIQHIEEVYKMEEATTRPPQPAVFAKARYGSEAGTGQKGLLFSSSTNWREQRRFALRSLRDFGFGKASMEDMITAEATKLCNSMAKELNQPVELGTRLNVAILNALWKIITGSELDVNNPSDLVIFEQLNNFIRGGGAGQNHLLFVLFPSLAKLLPAYSARIAKPIIDTLDGIRAIITKHSAEHRETFDENNLRDYLDVHIAAQQSANPGSSFHGEVGQQNEECGIIDLFLAGTETTSTTITWGILYMLHHPDVQEKMQTELDRVVGHDRYPSLQDESALVYTGAVLQEIHRCGSIVHLGLPHRAAVDIKVSEQYTIPRESVIFANILQAMRNPGVFEEPELFNPDRFLDADGKLINSRDVIPFLVGKRVCLGQSLAEKEFFLFFTQLLQTFTFHPAPGHETQREWQLPTILSDSVPATSWLSKNERHKAWFFTAKQYDPYGT